MTALALLCEAQAPPQGLPPTVITQLRLQNFRGFNDHVLSLADLTLIVGPNNAGKSSIVEALRLVGLVTSRYRSLQFHQPPAWLAQADAAPGVAPSLEGSGIDLTTVMHQYADPPAVIQATFQSGALVRVFIGPDGNLHSTIRARDGSLVADRARAYRTDLDLVASQPQVAPLVRDERRLEAETVRRNMSSTLAPSHFRNQLWLLRADYLQPLSELAEATWSGFAINDLYCEGDAATPSPPIRLLVRNHQFVGEVACMGHGLQMWLQTLWFMVRTPDAATVMLDEPDVYLHPDLQHRLMRLLRGRYRQLIIATHSAEMMSEVEPQSILIVNSRRAESRFATTPAGVQALIDRMGGVHNLQLARLASAHRCVMVEGEDMEVLRRLHGCLFPSADSLSTLPNMDIGGWSGWPYAVGSAMFMRNAAGQEIRVYCLLDSDYHTPAEVADRQGDAVTKHVELHVWQRKELENYLLVASTITRVIATRVPRRTQAPTEAEVSAKLLALADSYRDEVTDAFANEFYITNKAAGVQSANRQARELVDAAWLDDEGKIARCPGKTALSNLSRWSQDEFGVSFGAITLTAEMLAEEVPVELAEILRAIEEADGF